MGEDAVTVPLWGRCSGAPLLPSLSSVGLRRATWIKGSAPQLRGIPSEIRRRVSLPSPPRRHSLFFHHPKLSDWPLTLSFAHLILSSLPSIFYVLPDKCYRKKSKCQQESFLYFLVDIFVRITTGNGSDSLSLRFFVTRDRQGRG